MIINVPGINIEDIPNDIRKSVEPSLVINGGNILYTQNDTDFGRFLLKSGAKFTGSTWTWVVVFR